MAFIRKRGQSYYLVHNVRKKGRVHQLQLARLGRRPRISDGVIQGVTCQHPFVQVDWHGLKQRTAEQWLRPVEIDQEYLWELLSTAQNLNLDIAGLHFPTMEMTMDPALLGSLISELKLLRTTLDVKLRGPKLGASGLQRKERGLAGR